MSRITAGGDKGLRAAANLYEGEGENKKNLLMTGWELRYLTDKFLIETEFVTRKWNDTLGVKSYYEGFYIHSYYAFPLKGEIFRTVSPAMRWDRMGEHVFSNDLQADRITVGVNLGIEPKIFNAEIRFNYENYFKGYLPVHTNKLTVEFLAKF